MVTKNKNLAIELYRILFTTIIMLHHFRLYSPVLPFGGGYMATDFFFILSGVFVYKTYQKGQDEKISEPKKIFLYVKKRYLRLLMPLVVSNVLLYIVSRIFIDYDLALGITGFIKETLMVEVFSCAPGDRFNTPLWYVGILILASLLVFSVFVFAGKYAKKYFNNIKMILAIVLVVLYGAIVWNNGSGNIYISEKSIFDINSFIRGLCGIMTGACLGAMELPQNEHTINRMIIWILMPVFVYLLIWRDGYTRYDLLIYILILFAIMNLLISNNEWKCDFLTKLVELGGRAAYVAYIIHYPIVRILWVKQIFGRLDWKLYSLLYVAGIWIIAMGVQQIVYVIRKMKYDNVKKSRT